jgi:hypothetical protein
MRKLELDFQRRPAPSRGGWLLLLAGLVALGAALHAQVQLAQQQQSQAARLARLPAAAGAAGNPAANEQADDPALVAARQALERSRLPWAALYSALEAADRGEVALLAVLPDVPRRQVKIHAEARDFKAMLLFQRQLQQQPALAQVVLLDHTVLKEVAEQPVRFHLLAHWGGGHGLP